MPKFVITHSRTVRRSATFEAQSREEAIAKAREVDENESDWEGWDIQDFDPGTFTAEGVAPRNARFWQWHNGAWVKLTIRPGKSLSASYGGQHEEGYSYTYEQWTHEGDRIVRHTETQSRDCDGRLDESYESECHIENLALVDQFEISGMPEDAGIRRPEWTKVRSGQRDYAAEAMGY